MDTIDTAPADRSLAQRTGRASWPAWMAGGLTLITLALWLLGYGYAVAIESHFGIAQAHVVASPLDYLGLAGHAMAQLLVHVLDNARSPRAWWAGYAVAWPWVLGLLLAFWVMLAVLGWPLLRPLRRSATVGSGRLAQNVKAHWQTSRLPWVGVLVSVLVAVAPIIVTAMLWLGLAAGLSALSALPLLGHSLGVEVLQRWVVDPSRCAAVVPRTQRLETGPRYAGRERVARCVAVHGLPGGVVKGRLVAATSHVAVLFDPKSGAVWRVPVSGATVEPVATLDP